MTKRIATLLLFAFLTGCTSSDYKSKAEDPEQLHQTIKKITDIIVHDIFSPPVASRIYAYVSVAAYEAARHQDSTLVSLQGQLHGLSDVPQPEKGKTYCFPLASVQAALKMGRVLIFSENELDKFSERVLNEYKDSGMPEDVYERSVAYGSAHYKMVFTG